MGKTITVNSTLECPHGGSVQITTTNTQAQADEGYIATMADTFVVSNCSFQIPAAPSPIPSPCLTVQWIVPDVWVRVNGSPTVSETSVGICLSATLTPQGKVKVSNTQKKVSST
jgi:hypothetical protein